MVTSVFRFNQHVGLTHIPSTLFFIRVTSTTLKRLLAYGISEITHKIRKRKNVRFALDAWSRNLTTPKKQIKWSAILHI